MDNQYLKLFSFLESIKLKQEDQTRRGLNNYNMVSVVRKSTHEVGMHSNVIYSLINPDAEHFQGDLFLKLFIENILEPKLKNSDSSYHEFGNIIDIQAEEATEDNRRIDFTIKSDKYLIGIEMKVNARDLNNQIADYHKYLDNESSGQKVYIFYLTKYGVDASKNSLGSLDTKSVINISFDKDILRWLNASKNAVRNITNLNIALENYINIVQKITDKYKGNVMAIEVELLQDENKDKLKTALELDAKMDKIKGMVLSNFFRDLSKKLENKGINECNILDNYPARIIDDMKCKTFVSKSKKRPRFFGKVYILGNGRYLYVYIAVKSLCYGVLDKTLLNNEFKKNDISDKAFNRCLSSVKCVYKVAKEYHEMVTIDGFANTLTKYIHTLKES